MSKVFARLGHPFAVLVIALCYLLPLYWLLATSVKPSSAVYDPAQAFVFAPTFDAYIRAFQDLAMLQGIASSLLIAVATTVVTLVFAVPMAYAITGIRSRIIAVVLFVLIVLQMVPEVSTVIPLFQILASWGLLGSYAGVVAANVAFLLPYSVVVLLPFFRAVPAPVIEAARVDGANGWRVFSGIAVPMAGNGIVTMSILLFVSAWGSFIYAVTFLNDPTMYPITVIIAQQVTDFGEDWPSLMARAVIAAIPVLVLYTFGQRALVSGLSMGAVK